MNVVNSANSVNSKSPMIPRVRGDSQMDEIKETDEKIIKKKVNCALYSAGSTKKKSTLKQESFKELKSIKEARVSAVKRISSQNVSRVKDILNIKK